MVINEGDVIGSSLQKALLAMFIEEVGLRASLYVAQRGHLTHVCTVPDLAQDGDSYCSMVHSLPGGTAACNADRCARATEAAKSGDPRVTLCHAGAYNQAFPVQTGTGTQAVVLYGEMMLLGEPYMLAAEYRQAEMCSTMHVDPATKDALREAWGRLPRVTAEELERATIILSSVSRAISAYLDHESWLRSRLEIITHEIQTRNQAIVAVAENLFTKAPLLPREDIERRARDMYGKAMGLDTIVQTSLGDYLEDYDTKPCLLGPMVMEAVHLYEGEAERKGIHIVVSLQDRQGVPACIEVSRRHMQYALNNLVNNAVKYSFWTVPSGDPRYVKISGKPVGLNYKLTFENYGVGILPSEIEQGLIFQDTYQGQLTSGEHREGMGKGLYIVMGVVEMHGGEIQVESTPCVGDADTPAGKPHVTRFHLYLPYEQPRGGVRNG